MGWIGRVSIGFALAVGVSACASVDYVVMTYGDVRAEPMVVPSGEFRVFDRPDIGKIMTAPSIRSAVRTGVVSQATLGLVDETPNVVHHRTVAEAFLASRGRACTLVGASREILTTQFEHDYTCTSPASGALPGPAPRTTTPPVATLAPTTAPVAPPAATSSQPAAVVAAPARIAPPAVSAQAPAAPATAAASPTAPVAVQPVSPAPAQPAPATTVQPPPGATIAPR
ncbi:hypothetical protein [Chthonobacter rhizosphaerae]|uniref:hypothetical protein n=1 Tax=Chthonobacter rhizosphaerae TaxID=2735553 RepID=UPI0015EF57BA|nr:hypothetical protein [Chthonobacter rhizosphaerae]